MKTSGRPGLAEPDADRWRPSEVAALAAVATGGLMVSITLSMLVPVLPLIARDIGSSTTSTEWLLTSALLAAAVAVPIMGRLGDLYGKRLMLMVCAGFLIVGLAHLRPEPQPPVRLLPVGERTGRSAGMARQPAPGKPWHESALILAFDELGHRLDQGEMSERLGKVPRCSPVDTSISSAYSFSGPA